ncbi:tautomerase family protein [Paenibacillus sp. J5C_2022]|uniref:tautomerase family protein n=1 Tax=Paenibacillus sp. J5C2022 TaxID=2977129 RepID=UPI0021CFE7DD|nr:tautomerase family protein [Paenibacillus sp. J5C2022]MCU6707347.1 tautomerase family protein [Paenibacillus sp. J5C2022]
MPFVQIYYREGLLNKEELKRGSNCIHYSLIEHFNIPEDDYFHMCLPYPSNHFFYDPDYLLEGDNKRSDKIMHISITCASGRTINQKRKLYHSIGEAIHQHLNISKADIFITLNESSVENWSFGQGIAQMIKMTEGRE